MSTRDPILDIFYARITCFIFHFFLFFPLFKRRVLHTHDSIIPFKKFLFDFTHDLYLQQ